MDERTKVLGKRKANQGSHLSWETELYQSSRLMTASLVEQARTSLAKKIKVEREARSKEPLSMHSLWNDEDPDDVLFGEISLSQVGFTECETSLPCC